MTTPDDDLIERVARKLARQHYADRFAKPVDDPHVQANVDGNWRTFADNARAAIEEVREPTPAMLAAALPLTTIEVDRASMLLCEKALALLEPQGFPARHHADGINAAQRIVADWRTMIDAALNPAPAKPDGDA